ncbi:signal peptidase II [Devosia submarina]|uniref:signal peptidase II n=1 Tax=Devosia submarina TaxID=1173082 RepID=UPI000D38B2C7|nr:signal peptidase II [Devosia submarina]
MSQRGASLFLMLGVIGLDASTKEAALMYLDSNIVPVLPVLNLALGFNTGVSFGMFASDEARGWWTIVLATSVICAVVGWLWHRSSLQLERLGYASIMGGALGNLVDRLPDGAVTDFIDFHAGGWHFPTFNLADIAITAGVILLLVSSVRGVFANRGRRQASRP